ncbi:MAG TPA: transglutaminase-like cysteine peptidase [Pseudolabrys sp.]|nr:transglutaminase-like cysteine peptidase [Pseudolabrys sp.]
MSDALPTSGFARSQLVLLTPNILPPDLLPHRALPSAEPFDLSATRVPTGEISAKWRELQSRIIADEKTIAACYSNENTCSQAARRFLAIVKLAQKHKGRAQLGWLNRTVNMIVKPASDQALYGDVDYWASPLQTLDNKAGDCEDYAILKYVALRELGVGADDLRVVIVQDEIRLTEHAIVAVRSERKWLILDNRTMAILNTEDARNYRPLFALTSTPAVAAVNRSAMHGKLSASQR